MAGVGAGQMNERGVAADLMSADGRWHGRWLETVSIAAATSPAERTLLLVLFTLWLLAILRMSRSEQEAKDVPRLLKRLQSNLTPAEYR